MRSYFFRLDPFILDSEFEVSIALTEEDLESAFKLFHDNPFSQGPRRPQSHGLHCELYHFLPETSTIVVKYRKTVIGAVSVIKDSPFGLPADHYYPLEVAELRQQKAILAEATSIAIARHFRNKDAVGTHLLIKYIYNFAFRLLGATHVIFSTHPDHQELYTDSWKFKKLGPTLQYQSNSESQLQGLLFDLSNENLLKLILSYPTNEVLRNLGSFLTSPDDRFKYPSRRVGQIIDLVMGPDLLKHFLLDRTRIYEGLDMKSRKMFLEIYVQLYGTDRMQRFLNLDVNFKLREIRMQVSTQAGIQIGDHHAIGKILDISSKGCFIQTPSQLDSIIKIGGNEVSLTFRLGDRAFEARGNILWKNQGKQTRHPDGFGVKFKVPLKEIKAEYINWMKG